jgi:hypothetical protein
MLSGTKHRHQAGKAHPHRSFLFLIAEETRQTSQQLCEEAADAQEVAKDMVQMSRLLRQMRKENRHK